MNRIISRLLALLAAFLMLTSVAACKQYPERISFYGSSAFHRWPVEIGNVSLNGVYIRALGNGGATIGLPKNNNKEVISIEISWVEFYSKQSFAASFDIPVVQVTGSRDLPEMPIVKILIGRHGEITVLGPVQGSGYEDIEILRLCGKRTPENDASFADELEYLAANTNYNDPKRLALPLPDSSCPAPGH